MNPYSHDSKRGREKKNRVMRSLGTKVSLIAHRVPFPFLDQFLLQTGFRDKRYVNRGREKKKEHVT